MDFAKAGQCVVLTQYLDFGEILAATHGEKPSAIQIRSDDLDLHTIGAVVIAAFRQSVMELDLDASTTADPKRIRLRMLPLSIRR